MRRGLLVAAAACCLVAGCGGNPGDLLGLQVSGGPVRGVERMRVTADGRASCNDGKLVQLPSDTVLTARNIERDARPLIKQGARFAAAAPGRRTFTLRSSYGSVRWAEGGSGLPIVLPQAEVLALRLEQLCPGAG